MDPNLTHPLQTTPSPKPKPNLPTEIQTLHNLSLQGSWLTILTTTTPTTPNPPNPNLTLLTYHLLSLTKLRRYSEAISTLDTILPNLPNLPSLPFSLRLLHAILPSFVSLRSEAIDRLYALLSVVRVERRRRIVVACLIGLHTVAKEFLVAIELLRREIQRDCENVELLSRLGFVQLQFGDLDGAKASFRRLETVVEAKLRRFDGDQSNLDGEMIVNESEKVKNSELRNLDGDQSNLDGETIVNESEKVKNSELRNLDGELIVNESEKPKNSELMNVNQSEKPKNSELMNVDGELIVNQSEIPKSSELMNVNESEKADNSQLRNLDGELIVNQSEKPKSSELMNVNESEKADNSQLRNLDGELIVNESEKPKNNVNSSELRNVDGEMIVNESEKAKNSELRNVDGEMIVNESEKAKNSELRNVDGEAIVNESEKAKKLRNLIGRNRALLCLVSKDYVAAVREYDECISRDETDIVSINNKALCLMYLRDLSDSIKVIETSLERIPTVALNETVIVNLCSMYELAYVNHTDIKKTLSNWIARLAPDDFDSSCTRV